MTILLHPPAPVSAGEFLARLHAIDLLPAPLLQSLENQLPDQPLDGRLYADGLVAQGHLTEYQAEEILAGRGSALVLGQYRILDRVGAGGMGQVYKAEHLVMKRQVAIKIVSSHLVQDAQAVAHFYREVQIAAQLVHPNIVTAFDAARADGVYFLVMEYVDGIDLARLVAEGPLPITLACDYIRQAALGLQYAHERGFVHCDIKPANLLVRQGIRSKPGSRPGGSGSLSVIEAPLVKILDFGLARLISSGPPTKTEVDTATPEGSVAGTPDYMAPEQAWDIRSADIRSDLYSLGCTFYQCLTGQVPFPDGSWSEKLLRHQFEQPQPVQELAPEVPDELIRILDLMMAKDPTQRYQTPIEVADALGEWLGQQEAPPPQSPKGSLMPRIHTPPAESESESEPESAALPESAGPAANSSANSIEPVIDVARVPRHRGWRIPPLALSSAVAVGLVVAWLARPEPEPEPFHPLPSATAPAVASAITLASRPGETWIDLATAVAQAGDGDTIVLQGAGPFRAATLDFRGKACILRAAPGPRPQILVQRTTAEADWHPLFNSDRPLQVEGIDVTWSATPSPTDSAHTAHLVYIDGAPLRLVDCQLTAPAGTALIVGRQVPAAEVVGCKISGAASLLCLETGTPKTCQLHLTGSELTATQSGAAAICFWPGRMPAPAPVDLCVDRCRLTADRIVAVAGFPGGLDIRSDGSHFVFQQSLLSIVGWAKHDWRETVHWKGAGNHYRARDSWLAVEENLVASRGLEAWRQLWQSPETGSLEERPAEGIHAVLHEAAYRGPTSTSAAVR